MSAVLVLAGIALALWPVTIVVGVLEHYGLARAPRRPSAIPMVAGPPSLPTSRRDAA